MDNDMAAVLRQVMENPQFGNMVQTLKAQMGGEDGGIDPAKMMEKLPDLMTMLGPMMGSGVKESMSDAGGEKVVTEEREDAVQPEAVVMGMGENGNLAAKFFRPENRDKRNRLLAALKPYLSPARCTIVDRAMSAMQMGELLGTVVPPKQDH